MDIDEKLGWQTNDSLINIPHIENAIIITNPPYLSNYSASRKKIYSEVKKYYESSLYDDLYLIALDKMLEAQDFVVAIIPETFINSNFKQFNRLFSITILEENPFVDTDTPVCVACFDKKIKSYNSVSVYKNEDFINDLQSLNSLRIKSMNDVDLKFNDIQGWLALRAVDTTNPNKMIRFDFKNNIDYDWNNGIKVSSRLLSLIQIDIKDKDKQKYVNECNKILFEIREASKDVILSPFKGKELIDPNYHLIVDKNVIPKSKNEHNDLTNSNELVIRYLSTIETHLKDLNHNIDDPNIVSILKLILKELYTKGMNLSPFCQYFNIHNITYSIFMSLNEEKQISVLKYMVYNYINSRHEIYLSHGYSNIVLQVMSDNYSHKRKGNYGANKIADILKIIGIKNLLNCKDKTFNNKLFFLLSDKTGKEKFKDFAQKNNVRLSKEGKETEKYPDALIRIGDNYFIVEQKNMKEKGGGQDKQTEEITDFINRKPELNDLHYITFVDGVFFNQIDKNAKAKTHQQYNDIISCLKKYNNYFVNSYGFTKLINDYYLDYKNKMAAK